MTKCFFEGLSLTSRPQVSVPLPLFLFLDIFSLTSRVVISCGTGKSWHNNRHCYRCSAASRAVSLAATLNLRDPAIMRSIKCAEGGPCTPNCEQQIDGLICYLVWKETGFLGWRDPLFPSKWTDQSQFSPEASPPASQVRTELGGKTEAREKKKPLSFSFRTHFFPWVLSPFLSHLLSTLANTCCGSKASPFPECVSFSRSSVTPPTLLFPWCICNLGGGWRGSEEENGFYCSALMVFCV